MSTPPLYAARLVTKKEIRTIIKDRPESIVVSNGCFDVLHPGHIHAIEQAADLACLHIVLLNSDASVRALKGPTRPVHDEQARAYQLDSLIWVDFILLFDGPDCAAEILEIRPTDYAKSEEYRDRQNPAEAAALAEVGAKVHWIPHLPGYSTSAILAAAPSASAGPTPVSPTAPHWGIV